MSYFVLQFHSGGAGFHSEAFFFFTVFEENFFWGGGDQQRETV